MELGRGRHQRRLERSWDHVWTDQLAMYYYAESAIE